MMTEARLESCHAAGVKMQEGIASQGMQVASGIRKGKGMAFSPRASRRECSPAHALTLAQRQPFGT